MGEEEQYGKRYTEEEIKDAEIQVKQLLEKKYPRNHLFLGGCIALIGIGLILVVMFFPQQIMLFLILFVVIGVFFLILNFITPNLSTGKILETAKQYKLTRTELIISRNFEILNRISYSSMLKYRLSS